jgi:hypothetical protein
VIQKWTFLLQLVRNQYIHLWVDVVLLINLDDLCEWSIGDWIGLFFYVFLVFFDAFDFDLVVLVEGEAFGMRGFRWIRYEVFGIVGLFAMNG